MNRMTHKFVFTFLTLAFTIIFISGQSIAYERELKELSANMISKIEQSGKKSIAVTDFTGLQGDVTELGRFIAEELSIELMNNVKKFEIIDRNHLKSIMKEHKFAMSGLVDPKTIKEVGKIVGVDAIITGSVVPFGDNIKVTCKVIATDTARVISAGKINIAKTKAIDELLAKEIGDGVKSKSESNAHKIPEGSKNVQNNNLKTDKSKFILNADDAIIELLPIRLERQSSLNKIIIKYKITNMGKTRRFSISNGSGDRGLILDNFGNPLRISMILPIGQEIRSEKSIIIQCLLHDGISKNTKFLKMIRMSYKIDDDDDQMFEFKNVPVEIEY
jgi:TolB-like protein